MWCACKLLHTFFVCLLFLNKVSSNSQQLWGALGECSKGWRAPVLLYDHFAQLQLLPVENHFSFTDSVYLAVHKRLCVVRCTLSTNMSQLQFSGWWKVVIGYAFVMGRIVVCWEALLYRLAAHFHRRSIIRIAVVRVGKWWAVMLVLCTYHVIFSKEKGKWSCAVIVKGGWWVT